MTKISRQFNISVRNIIIIVFIIMLLLSLSVIGYIVFSNWMSSADEIASDMAKELNERNCEKINTFIHTPTHINEFYRELIEKEIININNEPEREKVFVNIMQTHSANVYSLGFGIENGDYYGARRNQNGKIEIMKSNEDTGRHPWYYAVNDDFTADKIVAKADFYDPREREWYKAARQAGAPVFSPIFKHFIVDDMTVSAAYPIYEENGKLRGVLGCHILLSSINRHLRETVIQYGGIAIVAEKNSGMLIANSLNRENFKKQMDGSIIRCTIDDLENPFITQIYNSYLNTGVTEYNLNGLKSGIYGSISEYQTDGLDWVIITTLPKSIFISDIMDNMKTAMLFVLLALLVSLLSYLLVTYKLFMPINSLISTAKNFSSGDLSQRATIVRNDEFGRVSAAFNNMADTIFKLVNNLEATVRERTAMLQDANTELNESREKLRLILDSTAEAIYGIDENGICTFCNASCIRILGYRSEQDILGKNMHELIHYSYKDGRRMSIEECSIYKSIIEGKGCHIDNEVFWRADGTSFDAEYYAYPQYKDGVIIGAVVTFTDITRRKQNDEQIRFLSCHDALTGLKNRRYFEESLKDVDNEDNLPISIVFADINGLKMTNDVYGHASGDALIKKSAEVMKALCRESDTIARVGGDEFIIIMPNTDAAEAEKIMHRIKTEFSNASVAAIRCSMSAGCDTKTSISQSIEEIMVNAENAMYKEKTLSRKTVNSDMINTIIRTLHDKYPRQKQHSETVSDLCEKIAFSMKLPETEVKKFKRAGYLHDIGKIALSESIMNKKKLSEEEAEATHQHSIVGYRILNLFDDTLDLAEGVYAHHEKWDGTGYPKGIRGREIPLMARVIAVAEVYDAITANTSSAPVSKKDALEKIKAMSGSYFDPEVVDAFIRVMSD
ncbi:MAG: putative diguanylate cyclase YegE [Firmicutes bacterium ADurb.Bin193]|nr:MAG: putative diguanylate cyclase YegE [Firmicutes bacterium ADurb.Bin193]